MFEQQELLEQLGSPYTNHVVDRFHHFAVLTPATLASLASQALSEQWGDDEYVLEKYLAVHEPAIQSVVQQLQRNNPPDISL